MPASPLSGSAPSCTSFMPLYCFGLCEAVTAAPPGYAGRVPYGFGVVELVEERLRIITRLREADPQQLAFGQPMTLVADELPDGVVTWAFA